VLVQAGPDDCCGCGGNFHVTDESASAMMGYDCVHDQMRADVGKAATTRYHKTVIIRQLVNFALSRNMIAADPLNGLRLRLAAANEGCRGGRAAMESQTGFRHILSITTRRSRMSATQNEHGLRVATHGKSINGEGGIQFRGLWIS
jgi:hypothetical protein